jgi:hypothetical protein
MQLKNQPFGSPVCSPGYAFRRAQGPEYNRGAQLE